MDNSNENLNNLNEQNMNDNFQPVGNIDNFNNTEIPSNDVINEVPLADNNNINATGAMPPNTEKTGSRSQRFKYVIVNDQGEKIKGNIDGHKEIEVKTFLEHEGYQIISVEASKDIVLTKPKLSNGDLAFILTQLSTYLKSGISLIDSVRILEKQSTKAERRTIFTNIVFELSKGESFSSALTSQGNVFPQLLINMVKTAEMTGDLPSILDDMNEYYTTVDRTKKATVSAMVYPTIIMIFAVVVVTFILLYIVPTFTSMFEENGAELPGITTLVINISDFLGANGLYIIAGLIVVIIIYSLLFKKVKPFKKFMQTIYMKTPVVGNMIIYKEVAMFTKTFASLLNHNVFITDTMDILSKVTSNEIFAEIIADSLDYLSKGAKLSESFRGKWAFPLVAYEMLVTGENTGRLAVMMDYVAKYYDDLHSNSIKRMNTFIEPVMILFLALIVGVVILAVIIPMFSLYNQVM